MSFSRMHIRESINLQVGYLVAGFPPPTPGKIIRCPHGSGIGPNLIVLGRQGLFSRTAQSAKAADMQIKKKRADISTSHTF
jgi:hypothetical protein